MSDLTRLDYRLDAETGAKRNNKQRRQKLAASVIDIFCRYFDRTRPCGAR